MSLSDLASLGSFISGAAVLASLVFLFFQMRQMTEQLKQTEKNQKALMNQGLVSRAAEITMWTAQPHVIELGIKARSGEKKFSAEELNLMTLGLRLVLLNGQDAYIQHEAGLADDMTFNHTLTILKANFRRPINRALWKLTRPGFAQEWAAFVDQLIGDTPLVTSPSDVVADFDAALTDVLGGT